MFSRVWNQWLLSTRCAPTANRTGARNIFSWLDNKFKVAPQPIDSVTGGIAPSLLSWGSSKHFQLGLNDADRRMVPTSIESLRDTVKSVSCGEAHTVVVLEDGRVLTFGWNESGQSGQDEETEYAWQELEQPYPSVLQTISHLEIDSASCGARHTALLTTDGEILMFGSNAFGQLGDGTTVNYNAPNRIEALSELRFKQVACGHTFTLAVTTDGKLYGWGDREGFQLGDGIADKPSFRPIPIAIEERIRTVSCGARHAVALAESGNVYGWGIGALYDRDDAFRKRPQVIVHASKPPGAITAVACGAMHTLLLDTDGVLYAWGANKYGQLGLGDTTPRHTPLPLVGLPPIVRVAAGWDHSGAVTADGRLLMWGNSGDGRLGLGEVAAASVPEPTFVSSLDALWVDDIALGASHSVARIRAEA